ncbi:glucuronate isomerase [Neiella sp. HB171785]|uniref:Uronate isomerase n=1 Tax=Neiella litorisoli TaxID=2771431 RepID=A0A8J6UEY8_9GAMM|nr:glucuronate isomerase [Neiella litorisoli]MBD1388291.1 glucuronate isomerase [Neiella litorisoli]
MNQDYIHPNFLLGSELARRLYHDVAAGLPIIDFHNHIEAKDIWLDTQHQNLAQAWLYSDHYVWRAMRSNGIAEHYITGNASDLDKFTKWCEAVPYLIGNPLYQWSHLELSRFFDCQLLINPSNQSAIWQQSNQVFSTGKNSTRSILQRLNVETLCTTDSPLSSLEYHTALAQSAFNVQVLPTFRADELFCFASPEKFHEVLNQLSSLSNIAIERFDSYLEAIESRLNHFHQCGCRLSDLGLPQVSYQPCSLPAARAIFDKFLADQPVTASELVQLSSRLFVELGKRYFELGWSMQLHIGVLMNVNQRRLSQLGAGTGFSVINTQSIAAPLSHLLSDLDASACLPNTVLYNLNPTDNAVLACIAGAFQDSDTAAGKVQLGAAWWFNDHKDGMESQLTTLKNLGALGRFVGMLTDSRNIFSFCRHEYFRRVLCNLLATWVEAGEIPNDQDLLKQTIENICYYNAKRYFRFD